MAVMAAVTLCLVPKNPLLGTFAPFFNQSGKLPQIEEVNYDKYAGK